MKLKLRLVHTEPLHSNRQHTRAADDKLFQLVFNVCKPKYCVSTQCWAIPRYLLPDLLALASRHSRKTASLSHLLSRLALLLDYWTKTTSSVCKVHLLSGSLHVTFDGLHKQKTLWIILLHLWYICTSHPRLFKHCTASFFFFSFKKIIHKCLLYYFLQLFTWRNFHHLLISTCLHVSQLDMCGTCELTASVVCTERHACLYGSEVGA